MDLNTAVNNAADQVVSMPGIAQANSAFNAEQARLQREWTEQQSAKAMQFNAQEAAKNRDWQQYMSNTAHQREVADLKAAGLNPVLSAMNGNGAAVTSGATASGVVGSGSKADSDTSTSAAIANLLGSILSSQTALENANINARVQEAVADKYNAMSEIVANINAGAAIESAGIHANASRYAADQAAAASRFGAEQSSSATRYSADQSKQASQYNTDVNAATKEQFGNSSASWIIGNTATTLARLLGGDTPVDKARQARSNDAFGLDRGFGGGRK